MCQYTYPPDYFLDYLKSSGFYIRSLAVQIYCCRASHTTTMNTTYCLSTCYIDTSLKQALLFLTRSAFCVMQYSSVSIETGIRVGRPEFDSRQGIGIFLLSTTSRPPLGRTQPPIQCVTGSLSPGVKRLGHKADQSPPPNAEVTNAWSNTSTPAIRLHGVMFNEARR
jgi:hypothetical protein